MLDKSTIKTIQKVGAILGAKLPFFSPIDGNDLAQESIMCALRGRKSIRGPMQDLMRSQGWFGPERWNSPHYTRIGLAFTNHDGKESLPDRFVDKKNPESMFSEEEQSHFLSPAIKRAMLKLPERKQMILKLYYWDGLTMKEIGKLFHVNESRVSQIIAVTLRTLRNAS